jgi:hypothetical protein
MLNHLPDENCLYCPFWEPIEKIFEPSFAAKPRLREDFSIGVCRDFILVYSMACLLAASVFEPASIQGKKEAIYEFT